VQLFGQVCDAVKLSYRRDIAHRTPEKQYVAKTTLR